MPLTRWIEMECDYCGHCEHSVPPLSYAREYFLELGYLHCNGRWYCDSKCRDNHRVKMKEERAAKNNACRSTQPLVP